MREIDIDIETYSEADLKKCGVYVYSEHPAFEILLFGYSADGDPVKVIDIANGEKIPVEILEALTDENITKYAHNATFERICLSAYLRKHYPQYFKSYSIPEDSVGNYLSPESWKCSMIWASYLALPRSLKDLGRILKLDEQKMSEGEDLIKYFCKPCRPTIKNGGRTRNLPQHDKEKWELFKKYNKRDVEVELGIKAKLSKFPVPDFVWDEYHLDQEINDRGILVDMTLVENAIEMDGKSRLELTDAMRKLTEVENPNSVTQMKTWLSNNGLETDTLGKKAVDEMLKTAPSELADALSLRQQLAKSSVKKYQAMQNAACADGRARGMFAFYGANRTGRWASRIVQLQNLRQNHMPDLAEARTLVRDGNYEAVKVLYEDVPETLSQLVRTAFIPKPGYKYVVADFSAIEARVLAFLAGEQWVLDTFASGGDIYCATASRMFGVPVEKNGINAELRQKGKQCTLSCGYGGGVGALKAMGAIEAGMKEEELQPLVTAWRNANPRIVDFWWKVDRAVKDAVRYHSTATVGMFRFYYQSGMLFIDLPSGRRLCYVKPKMGQNQFGGDAVTYEGINTGKWMRLESYGPKFVENIVQAVSRDILAYAMKTLRHCFIVGSVHDELIIECSPGVDMKVICEQMGRTPPWIEGIQLRADGYECQFYKKE